ncbi:MAG: lysophospholipase [Candidatus Omnitrophota bacterium]
MENEKEDIMYRKWGLPSPKAVFLLVHGLGGYSGRWQFLADFFLQHDISSYAIELRGFGPTKGPRGHITSFEQYFEDVSCLRDIISKENPGKKIFIIGESLGGLISFLAAAKTKKLFDGLILLSPAFKTQYKLAVWDCLKVFGSLFYNPMKQFYLHFVPKMYTRDVEYQKRIALDEQEGKVATAQLLSRIVLAQLSVVFVQKKLEVPVLFLISGADMIVNSKASRGLFKALQDEDKSVIEYSTMYHALSIDIGREKVFRDILQWISSRI